MLQPKKVKHRKMHRGRMTGSPRKGTSVSFGEWGLQVLEPGWITARQIEATRVAVTRCIKRGGKVWIRIFPQKSVTKKPAETRMGKGKGAPEFWVAVVKPGVMIIELAGTTPELAKEALTLASYKLPLKSRIVRRYTVGQSGE